MPGCSTGFFAGDMMVCHLPLLRKVSISHFFAGVWCLTSPPLVFCLFASFGCRDVTLLRAARYQLAVPKPHVWHGRIKIGEGNTMTGDMSQNDGMEHEGHHQQHVAGSGTAEGFSREGSREGSDADGRGAKVSATTSAVDWLGI